MITNSIALAKQVLDREELVAVPTETVYGLAGNAFSEVAVGKIFELKQRPLFNPLIVHIRSVEFLTEVACEIPEAAYRLAEAFWPGPLTLVLQKKEGVPDIVTAGKDTVAVRIPEHPLTLSLLKQLDFPLAAPSANPFSSISPTRAEHVAAYFGNQLEIILDGGPCKRGIESTIIGFENGDPVIYRLGSLPLNEIQDVIGQIKVKNKADSVPEAPGMLSRHYAPRTKTIFTGDPINTAHLHSGKTVGFLLFDKRLESFPPEHQEVLSETGDLTEAARNLYAALHRLDKLDLELIIAERAPDTGLGKTINDKLERASAH